MRARRAQGLLQAAWVEKMLGNSPSALQGVTYLNVWCHLSLVEWTPLLLGTTSLKAAKEGAHLVGRERFNPLE